MADKRLYVEVLGKDGLSRVFQEIGRSAQTLGKTLETAGKGAESGLDRVDDAAGDAQKALQQLERAIRESAQVSQQSMTTLGNSVDRAAADIVQSVNQVETALNEMDRATEQSSDGVRRFGDAGRELGTGLGLLGASFTMMSNAAADEARQVGALELIYGNAAAGALRYAESLQQTTVYSDDAARAALQMTGSLTGAYGVTAEQAQHLVSVSADLAAVTGRDLADATERVAAGVRGEAESLEVMGVNLSASAVAAYAAANGLGDFNAMTDEAAKAQIRYAYLLEQTTKFEGAAERQAAKTSGQVRQLANTIQDAGQDFAAWTGPIGEVTAGLGSFTLETGLALTGMVQLARGARTAVTAMGGLAAVAGPAGIALALGGAALAAYKFATSLGDDLDVKLKQTQDSAADLDVTIATLTGTMNDAALALTINQGDAAIDRMREHAEQYAYYVETFGNLPTDRLELDTSGMDAETQASIEQHRQALEYIAQYEAQYGSVAAALNLAKEAQDDYNEILRHHGPGAELALQATANLIDQLQAGTITEAEFTTGLDEIANGLATYDQQALQAAAATEQYTAALNEAVIAQYDLLEATRASTQILTQEEAAEHRRREEILQRDLRMREKFTQLLEAQNERDREARQQYAENLQQLGQELIAIEALWQGETEERELTFKLNIETDDASARSRARPDTNWLDGLAVAADIAGRRITETAMAVGDLGNLVAANTLPWAAYQQALADVSEEFGLLTTHAQQFQAVGLGGQSIDVAVNLQTGGDDLDRIFNTIVGQTNAMSQQMGGVKSWADQLIGDPGTWSQLDQLRDDQRIDQEQYDAAQEAQIRITRDVTNAQQDLLAVQANLAPVIADATRQQAEYIDGLQDLDTESQLAALGFMDQAQGARVLEIAQLAAASATAGQQAATTAMVQEMAAADPVLAAMLEKMGLISIGADGTITANFGEAESATAAIEDLNGSIESLITLLGDIFNVETQTNAPSTQLLVEALTGAINSIPDKVTTTVTLVDNASAQAGLVRDMMNLLDGTTATTFINTVYSTSGQKAPGLATGGTIIPQLPTGTLDGISALPHYANGGTHAIVGEYGREMVWLPNGAQVTPHGATESRLQAMGGRGGRDGGVHFYGPVALQPATTDVESAIRRTALSRVRGR